MAAKTIKNVGFRPTEEDLKIIDAHRRDDESTTDVVRRALRLLAKQDWEAQAREDTLRLRGENLADEPDEWEYDETGKIRVIGTDITVPARKEGST
jgi:Arc/MetJ-type ribon-helix-helix transcriptional regulator